MSSIQPETIEHQIVQFLGLFNTLDKYFDTVLHEEKFLPYNEKIKFIAEGDLAISKLVQKNINTLRYFGELRNHITHGIKTAGQTFVFPTDTALASLQQLKKMIVDFPTCKQAFWKKVFTCSVYDSLKYVLSQMREHNYSVVPVYQGKKFIGTLSTRMIVQRAAKHVFGHEIPENLTVGDIQIDENSHHCMFIAQDESALVVQDIFLIHASVQVVYITPSGNSDEHITGIATMNDLSSLS